LLQIPSYRPQSIFQKTLRHFRNAPLVLERFTPSKRKAACLPGATRLTTRSGSGKIGALSSSGPRLDCPFVNGGDRRCSAPSKTFSIPIPSAHGAVIIDGQLSIAYPVNSPSTNFQKLAHTDPPAALNAGAQRRPVCGIRGTRHHLAAGTGYPDHPDDPELWRSWSPSTMKLPPPGKTVLDKI
jgi:hypothetical protein